MAESLIAAVLLRNRHDLLKCPLANLAGPRRVRGRRNNDIRRWHRSGAGRLLRRTPVELVQDDERNGQSDEEHHVEHVPHGGYPELLADLTA